MILATIFDSDLLASTIRISVPVMLAALGGLITMRAGIYNIALEGQMIAGAFASIAIVAGTGNVYVGILGGVAAGVITSAVLAVAVLRYGANDIVASIAVNLLAAGATGFLLQSIFDVEGTYRPDGSEPMPRIEIPLVDRIPVVGDALSGQTLLVYVAFFLVAVTHYVLYRTRFGLSLRAVGQVPAAAQTAGVSPERIRFLAVLYSGGICGLGGAYLALAVSSEFTVGMIGGRGFTGFSAAIFGQLQPGYTMLASLMFGLAEALGVRVQLSGLGLPTQFVQMVPFVMAVLAITLAFGIRTRRIGVVKRREVSE